MITSTSNVQVKYVIGIQTKAKMRREEGVYVIEGLRMFKETPKELIEKVYAGEEFFKEKEFLFSGCPKVELVSEKVLKAMSDTKSPQGVICIVKQKSYDLHTILGENEEPLLVILEDIQDPGNMGTIFRTAEAAGALGVILSKNCVDIYNPKTIRATMGSIYRLPFFYAEDLHEVLDDLENIGIKSYGAHLLGETSYHCQDYKKGAAFVIGNEGNGLSEEISKKISTLIKIPMQGQVESLNAAMACGILLYEAARQRLL